MNRVIATISFAVGVLQLSVTMSIAETAPPLVVIWGSICGVALIGIGASIGWRR